MPDLKCKDPLNLWESSETEGDRGESLFFVFAVKWAEIVHSKSFDFKEGLGLDLNSYVWGLVLGNQLFLCQVILFSAAAFL